MLSGVYEGPGRVTRGDLRSSYHQSHLTCPNQDLLRRVASPPGHHQTALLLAYRRSSRHPRRSFARHSRKIQLVVAPTTVNRRGGNGQSLFSIWTILIGKSLGFSSECGPSPGFHSTKGAFCFSFSFIWRESKISFPSGSRTI